MQWIKPERHRLVLFDIIYENDFLVAARVKKNAYSQVSAWFSSTSPPPLRLLIKSNRGAVECVDAEFTCICVAEKEEHIHSAFYWLSNTLLRRYAILPRDDLTSAILAKVSALSAVAHDEFGFVNDSELPDDDVVSEIDCRLVYTRFRSERGTLKLSKHSVSFTVEKAKKTLIDLPFADIKNVRHETDSGLDGGGDGVVRVVGADKREFVFSLDHSYLSFVQMHELWSRRAQALHEVAIRQRDSRRTRIRASTVDGATLAREIALKSVSKHYHAMFPSIPEGDEPILRLACDLWDVDSEAPHASIDGVARVESAPAPEHGTLFVSSSFVAFAGATLRVVVPLPLIVVAKRTHLHVADVWRQSVHVRVRAKPIRDFFFLFGNEESDEAYVATVTTHIMNAVDAERRCTASRGSTANGASSTSWSPAVAVPVETSTSSRRTHSARAMYGRLPSMCLEVPFLDHVNELDRGDQFSGNTRVSELERSEQFAERMFELGWPPSLLRRIGKSDALLGMLPLPMRYRCEVWQQCSSALTRRVLHEDDYYERLCERISHSSTASIAKEVDLDLQRSIVHPHMIEHGGRDVLRRVLIAYALHNPSVGYCQAMCNHAAMFILVTGSEESSFWLLCASVGLLPGYFDDRGMLGVQQDERVLEVLLERYCPRLHRHFSEVRFSLVSQTIRWLLCLFIDQLRHETSLLVLDYLFVAQQSSILIQVAICLFRAAEDDLLQCDDGGRVQECLHAFLQVFTPDDLQRLLDEAIVSRDEIEQIRDASISDVVSSMVDSGQRRELLRADVDVTQLGDRLSVLSDVFKEAVKRSGSASGLTMSAFRRCLLQLCPQYRWGRERIADDVFCIATGSADAIMPFKSFVETVAPFVGAFRERVQLFLSLHADECGRVDRHSLMLVVDELLCSLLWSELRGAKNEWSTVESFVDILLAKVTAGDGTALPHVGGDDDANASEHVRVPVGRVADAITLRNDFYTESFFHSYFT